MRLLSAFLLALFCATLSSAQDGGESGRLLSVTWTYQQTAAAIETCGTGTTCAVTLGTAPAVGDVGVVSVIYVGDATFGVSSISGGSTWTLCSTCNTYFAATTISGQMWMANLSSTGTPFTVTMNKSVGAGWSVQLQVFRCVGCSAYGTPSIDLAASGSTSIELSCSPCAGPTISTSAGQDAVSAWIFNTTSATIVGSPYVFDLVSDLGVYAVNAPASLGTASYTMSSAPSFFVGQQLAIKP